MPKSIGVGARKERGLTRKVHGQGFIIGMQKHLSYFRNMTQKLQDNGLLFNKKKCLFSKLLVFSKLDLNIVVAIIIFD